MKLPWYKRLAVWLGIVSEKNMKSVYIEEQDIVNEHLEGYTERKKGNFRFPLIKDNERIGMELTQPTVPSKKQKSVNQPLKKQAIEKRENFQILKKAQEVPSPVFGFQKAQRMDAYEKSEQSGIVNNNDIKWDQPEEQLGILADGSNDGIKSETEVIDEAKEDFEEELEEEEIEEISEIEEVKEEVKQEIKEEIKNEVNEPKKPLIPYNVLYFGERTKAKEENKSYTFPLLQYLKPSPRITQADEVLQQEMIHQLERTLKSFNVSAKVIGLLRGPTVTRLEVQPEPGVKVNRITNLVDDIKLNLAAEDIRIEAPIPGKSAVGIEIPNRDREPVHIIDVIHTTAFKSSRSPLTVALGKDIEGKPVVMDLAKMPHGLIAGSTGSGKSVCINSIIISLLYKATPEEVKLILIDPKMVELAPYHDLPHLATPVVTDPKQATMALKWAVEEMERRYEIFAQNGVRDLGRYNELMEKTRPDVKRPALPYILIVIDELADLMMVSPRDVEDSIARIAQKARACGIHLLLATQRPSVDVITGMIKANVPTRVAFAVSSQIDSRTILDSMGAERLLGRGDMLLLENGSNKLVRIQGNFVSDAEIEKVCNHVRAQRKPNYIFDKESLITSLTEEDVEDDLFQEALQFVIEQEQASSSSLQRKFRIGYNRAARLIDMMEQRGFVSEASGSKPRNVIISQEEYNEVFQ